MALLSGTRLASAAEGWFFFILLTAVDPGARLGTTTGISILSRRALETLLPLGPVALVVERYFLFVPLARVTPTDPRGLGTVADGIAGWTTSLRAELWVAMLCTR